MIDSQGHFNSILISIQVIDDQPSVVDQNVNVFVYIFHLSHKFFNGLFLGEVKRKCLDEVFMFFKTLFFFLENVGQGLLIPGLVSASEDDVVASQIKVLHGFVTYSAVTPCDDDVEALLLHIGFW